MKTSITPKHVFAVWSRHYAIYRKTWIFNCIPPMSEPVIYLLAFGFGMQPLVKDFKYQGQPMDYLSFLAPGMIGIGVLMQSFFEGAYGTFVRIYYQRTWHAMLTTPLTFSDVFVGDWLWASTKGMIAGVLTGIVSLLWGILPLAIFLCMLPYIVLGSLVFGAFGMLSAGLAKRVDHLNVPVFLVAVPMFALCGTYFPRDGLPPLLHSLASFLPLAPLVDLLRAQLTGFSILPLSFLLLMFWMILFLTVAWRSCYRKIYR
jgi:lipooligosaccharide transport system permease protein